MKSVTLVVTAALVLAACAKDPAAMLISGNEISITVERVQPYFWSSGWELSVITRRHPDCQRRYALKPTSASRVKVDIFNPEPAVYILRQGKRWYVTELKTCGFQAYKDPPPEPGELIGSFYEKSGVFQFVANASKAPAKGDKDAATEAADKAADKAAE